MILVAGVSLDKPKGVFKPCRWCSGAVGKIDDRPPLGPPNAVARMICEGCERQTGWVSPKALRQAQARAA